MKLKQVLAGAVVAAVGLAGAVIAPVAASATTIVPYQFFSKLYSEGLGRAIDQTAWKSLETSFTSSGCTSSALTTQINSILSSTEFNGLAYSNAAKVEVAYRTVLNREPDSTGYTYWKAQLDGGATYASVLSSLEASTEFSTLATSICSNVTYGWGGGAPVSLSASGSGYSGSESGLQSLLNSTAAGGTVLLQARGLVPLTSTLTIPAGVTLATTGTPSVAKYAELGRLARQPGFTGPAINLMSGAKLTHVWIIGDRELETSYDRLRFNANFKGSTSGTQFTDNRVSNTAGASSLTLDGASGGYTCTGAVVSNNVIDEYSTIHGNQLWADGISNGCQSATITNNTILDPTDVGIIAFGGSTTAAQTSDIENNIVIQSGNASFALISVDASTNQADGTTLSFSGSKLSNNTIWTSPTTTSTFGIAVGTHPWFGNTAAIGTGASVTGNTSGSLSVHAETGIVVSGMLSVNVTGNTVTWSSGDSSLTTCPFHSVGAEVTQGYASGTIQTYTNDTYSHCVI